MKRKNILQQSLRVHFLFCLLALIVFSGVFFFFSDLDKIISSYFYDFSVNSWDWQNFIFIKFFYAYGGLPQLFILNILWVFLLIGWFQGKKIVSFKKSLLIIVSIFLSEFFVSICKEIFARARPRDIILFGGDKAFTSLWSIGEGGISFPSSHAKSGFILVVLFYFFIFSRPKIAFFFLIFNLLWGAAISFARIAVGGHFFSDVFFALILVHFVVLGVVFWLKNYKVVYDNKMGKILFIFFSILLVAINWNLILRFYPYLFFQK